MFLLISPFSFFPKLFRLSRRAVRLSVTGEFSCADGYLIKQITEACRAFLSE